MFYIEPIVLMSLDIVSVLQSNGQPCVCALNAIDKPITLIWSLNRPIVRSILDTKTTARIITREQLISIS